MALTCDLQHDGRRGEDYPRRYAVPWVLPHTSVRARFSPCIITTLVTMIVEHVVYSSSSSSARQRHATPCPTSAQVEPRAPYLPDTFGCDLYICTLFASLLFSYYTFVNELWCRVSSSLLCLVTNHQAPTSRYLLRHVRIPTERPHDGLRSSMSCNWRYSKGKETIV